MLIRTLLLTCVILMSGCVTHDFKESSPITVKKGFLGTKYSIEGEAVHWHGLEKHISSNPEALDAFRQSNAGNFGGDVLAYFGGSVIGASFGIAKANDESVDSSLLAGGVALLGLALVVLKSAEKHMTNGVNIFNSALVSSNGKPSPFINVLSGVYVTDSQLGVSFNF